MKSCGFKTKKVDFVDGYRFLKSLRTLLCVSLCVCTGLFQISCAADPGQTYLTNKSLSGVSKVAIVASVSAPKVYYATTDSASEKFFPFVGLFPVVAEAAIRSGVDRGHAGKVRDNMDFSHFEEKVAQSFIQMLRKSDCFQATEYLTDKNQDVRQLSAKGYDAIIRLFVREISLKRMGGDQVRLDVYVRGKMEYLSSVKVVWDREEHIFSAELHPLNYYKENGLEELDAMLEKAGRNLAYDFVYLK